MTRPLPTAAPRPSRRDRSLAGPAPLAVALAAALAAALATVPAAIAQEAEAPEMGAVVDGPYFVAWLEGYVRAEPSAEAERLATLPFGAQVAVTGETGTGDWLRVELEDGRVGYVWAEVLRPARVALGGGVEGAAGAAGGAPGMAVSDDNTPATAQQLAPPSGEPQSVSGTVGPEDPVDMYRFQVDDWTEVTITLYGLSADADLSLLAEDGTVLGESLAGGTSDEQVTVTVGPGSYVFEIYQFEGQTGYTVEFFGGPGSEPPEDEAGNTPDAAFELGSVQGAAPSIAGWVAPGLDDVDYIAFDLPERSRVTIDLTGLAADADLSLDDAQGYELVNSMLGGNVDERIETALDAGRYFLRIYPFDGATDYLLTVTAQPTGAKPQ